MRNNKTLTMTIASLFAIGVTAYSSLAQATSQTPPSEIEPIISAEAEVTPGSHSHSQKKEEQDAENEMMQANPHGASQHGAPPQANPHGAPQRGAPAHPHQPQQPR